MEPPTASTLLAQALTLILLAMPVAAVTWTVTHEEICREFRDWCQRRSQRAGRAWWQRKTFYLVTCEYCFSHWVALGVVAATGFRLVLTDWRGAAVAWLALVWMANVYMTAFVRLRLDVKEERLEIAEREGREESRPDARASRGCPDRESGQS